MSDNAIGQPADRQVAAGEGQVGQIAMAKIMRDLLEKVEISTNAYLAKTEKLLTLGIELRPLWKRNFKIVEDSVDALDKTRADARTLLCEDATEGQSEANIKKLRKLDMVASMHLQILECALDEDLPSVITEMESLMDTTTVATTSRRSQGIDCIARGLKVEIERDGS